MDEDSSFPSEFQRRTLWRAVTGVAILILGALLVGLIWLTRGVLGYLQPVLVPVAVAGILAYLLNPVVQWLQKKGLNRIMGIISVFSGFILFFGILSFFIGSQLSTQVQDALKFSSTVIQGAFAGEDDSKDNDLINPTVIAEQKSGSFGRVARIFFQKDPKATQAHLENGGAIIGLDDTKWRLAEDGVTFQANGEEADDALADFIRSDWTDNVSIDGNEDAANVIVSENFGLTRGGHLLASAGAKALSWLSDSSGKILGFFGVLLGLAMVPIYLYYFLKESDGIKNNWEAYVPLKASKFKTSVVDTLKEINGYLISFFRGQVLVAFIDGILVGLALSIFGLNYGLLIGVCMALLGIIPYIGNILCLVPACVIAVYQTSGENAGSLWGLQTWGAVLAVIAIFVVVQQINSLVTAPKIVGDSVGLHPMTVIFSMLFWSLLLGGLLGALLAVPLTAAVKVLFRRFVWERQHPEESPPEGLA